MAKTKIIKKSVWCHYIFLPHIIICLSQFMWVYPVNFTSDRRQEGDWIESQHHIKIKMLKMVPTAAVSDAQH